MCACVWWWRGHAEYAHNIGIWLRLAPSLPLCGPAVIIQCHVPHKAGGWLGWRPARPMRPVAWPAVQGPSRRYTAQQAAAEEPPAQPPARPPHQPRCSQGHRSPGQALQRHTKRERERVCVCACVSVSVRERDREREGSSVYAGACMSCKMRLVVNSVD